MNIIKRKFLKLIKDPNLFFFDFFSKRIGIDSKHSHSGISNGSAYLTPSGYDFDESIHPWIQIAKKFNLRTGAITGHPDQSFLVNSNELLEVILFTQWITYSFKCDLRIYTLGGSLDLTLKGIELLDIKKATSLFSKLRSKPDFVLELLGSFDNNFAAHLFLFDINQEGIIVVKSDRAFIKKCLPKAFNEIYPDFIDRFGDYDFGTPWPVDIVFTWVDKNDPSWRDLWCECFSNTPIDEDRFSSRDELRYSLRALCKFLPWFRKVHIVSNCACPEWLIDHPKLNWVSHHDIFPDTSALPTFNSHAIESCLHRIPGLEDKFIYFNDDVFVNQPCYYTDFFDEQGRTIAYLEPYGMVHNDNIYDVEKNYLLSSINSQRLIGGTTNDFSSRKLHRHTPFSLNKKILEELEEIYLKEFNRTRFEKLRSKNDINVTSFLFHHYAIATLRGVIGNSTYMIVRPENINEIIKLGGRKYKFLCFNDGNQSATNKNYTESFLTFAKNNHPTACTFETKSLKFGNISLSIAIMAYKTRRHRIPYIRKILGNCVVSLDQGQLGLLQNSYKCWGMYESKAQYHMVINDDAVICKQFYKRLSNLLCKFDKEYPNRVFCLYFSLKNESKEVFVNFNQKAINSLDEGVFLDKYLRFGIALVVPTELIPKMIAHAKKLDLGNHDDSRYSHFFAKNNILVAYPIPSLVDQDPSLDSTHSGRSNKNANATWFADGENKFIRKSR